ncbi:preprotein translocase subunit YajC [Akkermansiaceae bacterium]|nr:preprotein translocase subunit YajC [Akkermansiaceae bacterium]MDB4537455.1 preprotein translocase subunit YajC [Akkermansiaceae bacterium]
MNSFYLLAADGQSGLGAFMPMILILIIFYFILIRPQTKARKELEARIASITKGDKVITTGGIHGIVHHVSDKTVTLKVTSEGALMKFEKPSIQVVNKVGKGSKKTEETHAEEEKSQD